MENAPELPMSHQQLEAFLDWALQQPSLRAPLSVAPDAAAVAAIATAAGFEVCSDDLLSAAGEPPEVIRMVELVAVGVQAPPSELEAFLQQVELDHDLQRVLATAADAEGVAAVARIAGYGVSAADVWAASDESPEVLREPDLVLEFWPDLGLEGIAAPAAEPAAAAVSRPESAAAAAAPESSCAVSEVGAPEVAAPEVATPEAASAPPASERLLDPWGAPVQGG